MPPSCHHQLRSLNVAVIGAGASGLVAARELRREGHEVVVFERGDQVGGTWVYTSQVESDLLGVDPGRPVVHSSVYESLRTNLPRETMGFLDFPFVTRKGKTRDPRRFPGHREVLLYLQEFASEFGIEELVRFECEVITVEINGSGKWTVKSKSKRLELDDGDGYGGNGLFVVTEFFDAVVVCSGHYTQPRIAEIPGINLWPGKQMHSHNYRTPEPFRDQVVVLIGSSASAADLSFEIAGVAKAVHTASRSVADNTYEKKPGLDNVWIHSMIESVHEDGRVVFQNGNAVLADAIIHCTGFKYHYPFLNTSGIVTVDDNRVGPLYKHIFPPSLAPFLSFVGIAYKVPPFPLFELQSKWIAGVLSGRIPLPSREEMMEDVNAFYSMLEVSGVPKRHTHNIGNYVWDYANWLADQCQCPGFEEWRKLVAYKTLQNLKVRPYTYRDDWQDDHLIASHKIEGLQSP